MRQEEQQFRKKMGDEEIELYLIFVFNYFSFQWLIVTDHDILVWRVNQKREREMHGGGGERERERGGVGEGEGGGNKGAGDGVCYIEFEIK